MAISPIADQAAGDGSVVETVTLPSTSYFIDFETGDILNQTVDGLDALQQSIFKRITTDRFRHSIYSSDYGTQLEDILAEGLPFDVLRSEIPREIKEALMVDDRINDVSEFIITQNGDSLNVSFTVFSVFGTFGQGVDL